jgi:hypothetical protein
VTVAVLFADPKGVYAGLPGVDLWDEARDARLYDGPYPVVAHPPCKVWSMMGNCRPELRKGEDGGCFEAALHAVRTYGGVLEHPVYTRAWRAFELHPPMHDGWNTSLFDAGFTAEVDQAWYGHPCNKRTWLYYVGTDPPDVHPSGHLRWGLAPFTGRTVRNDGGGGRDQRSRTPVEFRDVLLGMARTAFVRAAA